MTITAQGRACLFGEVAEAQMRLNEAGSMVQEVWWGLSQRFAGVEVGSMVVMPNRVHGVIALHDTVGATLVVALLFLRRQPDEKGNHGKRTTGKNTLPRGRKARRQRRHDGL